MADDPFVDMRHARFDDQRAVMRRIIEAGHCPFCRENILQYHEQPLIHEGKHWILTPSQWPYASTRLHLLIISKLHITKLADLPPEAGLELIRVLQYAETIFDIPGGAFAMRFGNTSYSAASVMHLHGQLIVPDIASPDYKPVRFKIGARRS